MHRKKTLIVDDEAVIAKALSKILEKLDYETIAIAPNSTKALECLERETPDIIFMDIRIDGDYDGIETAAMIKEKYDIPLIYISSMNDDATIERAKKTHPFGFIVKPFEEKDINVAVEMSIYKHEMEKKLRESEQMHIAIINSLSEGIIYVNSRGVIETCNPAAEIILNAKKEDLVDLPPFNSYKIALDENGSIIPTSQMPSETTFSSGLPVQDKIIGLEKNDGSLVWLSVNTEIIFSGANSKKVKGVVVSFKDITLQRSTEQAYRAVVDNSLQGVLVVQNNEVVFANNAAPAILGLSMEQVHSFKYSDMTRLLSPDDFNVIESMRKKSAETKRANKYILHITKGDGEKAWIEIYSSYFHFRGASAMQLVFIDISDKKFAEQMLIDSEERFRGIFENSNDGIALTDENGVMTEWNSAMEKITGYSADEIKGEYVWDVNALFDEKFLTPEMKKKVKRSLEIFYETGKAPWLDMILEFNMLRKDGAKSILQQVGFKVDTRKGFLLCSINRDISELVEVRKSLLESENRLRLALESVNDAIWDINPADFSINYLSPKLFNILGFEFDETKRDFLAFADLFELEQKNNLIKKIDSINLGSESFLSIELKLNERRGDDLWLLARAKLIEKDADNKPLRLIGTFVDISERIKMENSIKESENIIRTLLNSPNDSIGLFDLDGSILAINEASAKMINKKPKDMIGKNYYDYLSPELLEARKVAVEKAIETKAPYSFMETTDDVHREYSIYPVFDSNGEIVRIAAFAKDLTKIINTRRELELSESRYRMLFEETPISHWILDLSEIKSFLDNMKSIGVNDFESFINALRFDSEKESIKINIVDVNNYTLELFEAKSKTEFKNNFYELFLHDSFTDLKKLFIQLYSGEMLYESEFVMRTMSGKMVYGYWKFSLAPESVDIWNKIIVSGIDISAKKQMEFALQESEKTLRAILSASPIGIGMAKNRTLLWANEAFFDLLGYKENDLKNKHLSLLYDTVEESDANAERLYSQLNSKGLGMAEVKLTKKDGERIDCLVLAKAIDGADTSKGQILAFMDITERRKTEEQRKNIIKLTMEAEKQKNEAIQIIDKSALLASVGVIAGGITHEINQPLNAIRMGVDGILFWDKQNKILPEMMTEMLEGISEAANRIDEIVKHMRSFWVEPNKKKYDAVNLNNAVDKALSLVSQKMHSSEIKLKLFTDDEDLFVNANPVQLELIINNLIINASHALNEANVKDKWIKIKTYKRAGHAYIEISDNGVGLPENVDPQKLFDPFYSTRKPDEGSGLGLAIVKMFADRFGAKVSAKNGPDGGAMFTIQFKCNEEN
jgi:PAS domain S-box-containing protein